MGNWMYYVMYIWFVFERVFSKQYYKVHGQVLWDIYLSVRQSEEELSVEAPGPSQRRVDGVEPVCRSDHHNLTSTVQPVHQSQERWHDGAAGQTRRDKKNWTTLPLKFQLQKIQKLSVSAAEQLIQGEKPRCSRTRGTHFNLPETGNKQRGRNGPKSKRYFCIFAALCSDLCIWSCLLDRTGARPSISSKKMMEGRIWYAWGRHTPTHTQSLTFKWQCHKKNSEAIRL